MLALSDTTPWDPRRSEDHATLIGGLRRLGMMHDAIAVPRPGKMDHPYRDAAPPKRVPTIDPAGGGCEIWIRSVCFRGHDASVPKSRGD